MDNLLPALTYSGFIIISIVFYFLLLKELKTAIAKTAWDEPRKNKVLMVTLSTILGWTLIVTALGLSGVLLDFSTFPPRFGIILIIPLVTITFVTFSKTVKELLPHIPAAHIVRLQIFRVFVEVVLWMLVVQKMLPEQMSFEGRNFDVISGITAPLAAFLFVNNKTLLRLWNFMCLGLLLNIVTIAILSLPTPMRYFMNEPSNTIVAAFPYIWLPGLLVPLAYGLNFLSLRQISLAGSGASLK